MSLGPLVVDSPAEAKRLRSWKKKYLKERNKKVKHYDIEKNHLVFIKFELIISKTSKNDLKWFFFQFVFSCVHCDMLSTLNISKRSSVNWFLWKRKAQKSFFFWPAKKERLKIRLPRRFGFKVPTIILLNATPHKKNNLLAETKEAFYFS